MSEGRGLPGVLVLVPVGVLVLLVQASCARAAEEAPTNGRSAPASGTAPPVVGAVGEAGAAPPAKAVSGIDAGEGEGATTVKLEPLPPDAPFQGTVTVLVGLGDDPADSAPARYTFTMQGKNVRWDLHAQGGKGPATGYRVYDGAQGRFFTVLQHVVYATAGAAPDGDAGAPRAWKLSPFKLDPHGAVKGVPCDRMETSDDRIHYGVCVARGLPTLPLQRLGGAMAKAVPFGAELASQGLFPLSVLARPKKAPAGPAIGPLVATLTVVDLTRGRVPDGTFEIPPYRVVETPALLAPGILR